MVSEKGKRMAANVQQADSFPSAETASNIGQHTLTTEQYEQLVNLLSRQQMAITPHTDDQHSTYLAGPFVEQPTGLYLVDTTHDTQSNTQQKPHTVCLTTSELWHCRLGHPSVQYMAYIPELSHKKFDSICSICPQAKQHRSSFPSSTSRANKMFELLHVDIWGPYRVPTYDGYKLFLSIVDDFSRATWVFLLSHKSSAFSMLESFTTYVTTQFLTQVQVIRTDNGPEFTRFSHGGCIITASGCSTIAVDTRAEGELGLPWRPSAKKVS